MRLSGPWCKLYLEFFDTEELKLIKAMPASDELIVIWFELVVLAGKLGCDGRLLFLRETPYTDEMLAATLARSVPSMRQSISTFIQLRMMEQVDGVYAISDWSENQNSQALNAIREHKAASRARRNGGKTASDRKRARLAAFLTEHPDATKAEMHKATGLSRVTIDKYLSDSLPLLPAPPSRAGEDGVQGDVQNVQSVQSDVQNVQISGVQMDVQLYTGMYTEMYTTQSDETAGNAAKKDENGGVQNPPRPKNIDDRYKKSSTSTAGRPHDLSEVEAFFAQRGLSVDARRFWEVNEARGWVTATGRPVDDWRRLALTWQAHEHAPTPQPGAGTPATAPTVESVMERFKVSREEALELMGSGLT